ncbi:MAG: general secretion pathway protein GspK [Xanthobacteraceae bacterium]
MRSCRGNDGFIVVAVLWMLAALATLAVVYSLSVRETAAAFHGRGERVATQALTQAGVELAVAQLSAVPEVRPSYGSMTMRLSGADIIAAFRAENGRIDLNAAPREVLAGLFAGLGARHDDAATLAERITAWRTPPKAGSTDEEVALYRVAGRHYAPRRNHFQHVNEVGLVLGMPPVLLDRALPYLTVYSGQPEVNVLTAAPEVLAAMPGLTPERLHDLVLARESAPQDVLRARLGPTARYVTAQAGNAARITVDVRFPGVRPTRTEVVALVLDGDTEPYRVLSWRDDVEEAAPAAAGGRR